MADAKKGDATCDAAMLFELIWTTLVDLLGSAATAAVIHRCIKRAVGRAPQLNALAVTREHFEYRYVLPPSWIEGSPAAIAELRELTAELQTILTRLTGPVVLNQLYSVPELHRCRAFNQEIVS